MEEDIQNHSTTVMFPVCPIITHINLLTDLPQILIEEFRMEPSEFLSLVKILKV